MHPFPTLTTPRLLLRDVDVADASEILFLRSDEEMNRYIQRPADRKTETLDDARLFIQMITEAFQSGDSVTWGITLHESTSLIGTICYWNFSADKRTAELGYGLHPAHQGQGIMDEALKTILSYGFSELSLTQVEAYTHRDNRSSKNLLIRNHFHLATHRKDEENPNNEIYELVQVAFHGLL